MEPITNFKTRFNGGTRANRFYIEGNIPAFSTPTNSVNSSSAFTNFHVRSTQIPQLSTKTLSYDYFGRKYHYPGEKDYGTWSFTVLDDNQTGNGNLWKKFHAWQNAINDNDKNISFQATNSSSTTVDSAKYKATNWKIQHLNLNGDTTPLKTFIMQGCWPTSIQPITFNMNNPNVLNSFVVIMVYDYIELQSNGSYITQQ
jgi:hypothetical protein